MKVFDEHVLDQIIKCIKVIYGNHNEGSFKLCLGSFIADIAFSNSNVLYNKVSSEVINPSDLSISVTSFETNSIPDYAIIPYKKAEDGVYKISLIDGEIYSKLAGYLHYIGKRPKSNSKTYVHSSLNSLIIFAQYVRHCPVSIKVNLKVWNSLELPNDQSIYNPIPNLPGHLCSIIQYDHNLNNTVSVITIEFLPPLLGETISDEVMAYLYTIIAGLKHNELNTPFLLDLARDVRKAQMKFEFMMEII